MEFSSITEIWRYLRWLPRFLLRRIFTKKRLADLIIADVRARYESVAVDLSEAPSFRIWFQLINMSPFSVELDRAEIEFFCRGVKITKQHIRTIEIKSGQIIEFSIEGDIPEGKANEVVKNPAKTSSSVAIHINFNCKVYDFKKDTGLLEGVHVEYRNYEQRSNQVASA